jgi:hypothetical protein
LQQLEAQPQLGSQAQLDSQPQLGSQAQLDSQAQLCSQQQLGSQQLCLRWNMPHRPSSKQQRFGQQLEAQPQLGSQAQLCSQQQLCSQPQLGSQQLLPPPHRPKMALALPALPSTRATPNVAMARIRFMGRAPT